MKRVRTGRIIRAGRGVAEEPLLPQIEVSVRIVCVHLHSAEQDLTAALGNRYVVYRAVYSSITGILVFSWNWRCGVYGIR